MTGPWKHPLSGLSRDEAGHDGFEKPSSGGPVASKCRQPKGVWGRGRLLAGLPWGFWLSMGGLTRLPPFLFCFAFLHNHHRPRTRKPRLPSTGDFWERPQCSRTRPATQRGQKRTSSSEHQEQLLPLRPGPPVEGWRHPQPSGDEWVLPSLFGCGGAQDNEDLWGSLQRHREEFVPRLAADLLGVCTQQHLRVFKLIHDSLKSGSQERTVALRGVRDPDGTAKKASLPKSFRS